MAQLNCPQAGREDRGKIKGRDGQGSERRGVDGRGEELQGLAG